MRFSLFFFLAENNGSLTKQTQNNFETFLQNFEDFVALNGVSRDVCPDEPEASPLDDFPELFTGKRTDYKFVPL